MKTTTITCDVCGKQLPISTTPFDVQAYTTFNLYDRLFQRLADVCSPCREEIVKELRLTFNKVTQQIKVRKNV